MTEIRRILVATDFSEPSHAALDYAAAFARPFGATVDVLHVWAAPVFVPPMNTMIAASGATSLVDVAKRSAEDGLEQFMEEATRRGIAVNDARTEMGNPVQVIVDVAKTGNYDLVVIGTHGRTGLSRALIGSVAERVVRLAPCPVLSVRPRAQDAPA